MRIRWRAWWCGCVAFFAICPAAVAQVGLTGGSPGALPDLAGTLSSAAAQTLVLEIVINGVNLGEPSNFELRNGQLYAQPETLDDAGVRVNDLKPGADGWIALASIPGVRASYSAAQQQALLTVDDNRRVAQKVGYRTPPAPKPTPGTGFVLNYDITYQRDYGLSQDDVFGLWSEQRFFTPFGVFDNTGTYLNESGSGGSSRYTRLDTNWSYANPDKLFTINIGDAVSGALPWSRSVRFAGVQIQRDFSLRPDLITFPLPALNGSAAVPSAVDLYINGLRQYSGEVAPGPFQIAQAPSVTGAGVAQIAVTDALGRRVMTSVPLYIDARLLARGLFSYSAEFGFLRDNYTIESWSYEASPVVSGVISYGVTDWLTVQAHAEGGQGLSNGGAGALIGVGNAGVISAAAAASRVGGMSGALVSLGYQYIGPRVSFTLQGTQTTSGYRDIAALDDTSIFRHVYQATTSIAIFSRQSATLSVIDSEDTFSGRARVVTLGYNAQFGRRWSLFATAYRDFLQKNVWGGSVGITLALGGNMSISKTVSQSGGQTTVDLTASRPADFSGGWGWTVQGGAGTDYRHAFAGTNYRTNIGDFQATAQRFNGTTSATVEAAGALAFMDGVILPARTITDGFALVSTDGVAKVPVSQENRLVGLTNSRGYLLVPDLASYQRNQITIDPLALPADTHIDRTQIDISSERRAGVLAHFGMSRYQGASIMFVDDKGQPLPPGAAARNANTGETAIIGYDGVAFFNRLNPLNDIAIKARKIDCATQVTFDPASAKDLPQIGPFVCASTQQ